MLANMTAWLKAAFTLYVIAWCYLLAITMLLAAACIKFIRAFLRFRVPQQVVCPTTGDTANLTIAPAPAALAALFGERDIRLRSCSRDARLNCDRACVVELRLR